jgi:hypothetical protein
MSLSQVRKAPGELSVVSTVDRQQSTGHAHALVASLLCLGLCSLGRAQSAARPSEDDLFGGAPSGDSQTPPSTPAVEEAKARPLPPAASSVPAPQALPAVPAPLPDILAIGGQLYLRSLASLEESQAATEASLSTPSLVDGYFDARPNERVRGYLRTRLFYDPAAAGEASSLGSGGTAGGYTLPPAAVALYPGLAAFTRTQANPRLALDQLWIAFDAYHTLFVTAGKQHVKWGSAHFWNPTDFLHSTKRDPLAVFDERTGVTMLKLHVPWEARGWNFYGIGLVDLDEPAKQVGSLGGAGRAEFVFGTAELGIDAVVKRDTDPRLGADISAGVGDFDIYAESGMAIGQQSMRWRPVSAPRQDGALWEAYHPEGLRPATTAGVNWSWKYSDEDMLTLGAEYFYNPNGYASAAIYPGLLLENAFTPFYLGRHYLGAYVLLPRPGTWNNSTVTLSTLGNLSDRSFISRVDFQVLVLTYLRVEAYGAVHYGNKGEFRFSLDVPPLWGSDTAGQLWQTPPVQTHATVFDLGLAINMSF